jgi:hypothetical protein
MSTFIAASVPCGNVYLRASGTQQLQHSSQVHGPCESSNSTDREQQGNAYGMLEVLVWAHYLLESDISNPAAYWLAISNLR